MSLGLFAQDKSKVQVAAAGFPKTLLSQAAACSTLEELERALRSEKGFLVAFTDVASFVDLHRILYQWEGQFVLSGPFADGEATARFTTPEAAKEVRDLHAGRMRVVPVLNHWTQDRTECWILLCLTSWLRIAFSRVTVLPVPSAKAFLLLSGP